MTSESGRSPSNKITWPLVVLTLGGLGFFVGLFALIPRDMPEGRTALLGLLILGGQGVVTILVQRIGRGVASVERQTNGHMTRLIQAKTTPDEQP